MFPVMRSVRVVALRAAVVVAVFPATALLACRVEDMDFDFDFGDAGLFGDGLFGPGCTSDDQCGSGRCCMGAVISASCEDLVTVDPTKSVCSTTGDGHDATCFCIPPQTSPLCPPWILKPPLAPECLPRPYVQCGVYCLGRICFCDTQDGGLADLGPPVPSCPPPDWEAVCPSTDGGDGG